MQEKRRRRCFPVPVPVPDDEAIGAGVGLSSEGTSDISDFGDGRISSDPTVGVFVHGGEGSPIEGEGVE